MITVKEIENLAKLARIKLGEDEKKSLTKEIDSILTYIDQIKEATVNIDHTPTIGSVHNVFREDIAKPINREDRDRILTEAPDKEGDFITVKKIIEQ